MRPLLLAILVIASAAAADHTEVITLADGRSFTGSYDEEAGVLHTATPAGKAFDLKLAADQIADRSPAKKPAAGTGCSGTCATSATSRSSPA